MNIDEKQSLTIGNNVQFLEQDDKIVLIINKTKQVGPSASGKMLGIGSTGGFTPIPGGFKLNLYLGRTHPAGGRKTRPPEKILRQVARHAAPERPVNAGRKATSRACQR